MRFQFSAHHFLPIALIVFFFLQSCATYPQNEEHTKLQIAFGSCSNQERDFDLFHEVVAGKPDYFIWLGDMVYPKEYTVSSLTAAYEKQYSKPSYAQLRNSPTKIFGIYDDHDYGQNDGGKNNPIKEEARLLMMDFLDIDKASAQGKTMLAQKGAYQRVQIPELSLGIYILDTRWSRSDLTPSSVQGQRYQSSTTGAILSDEQWQDFEEFTSSDSMKTLLLVSSIQLLNDSHHFEKWGNFPQEREKMIAKLERLASRGVKIIVLSGDRHFSEISQKGGIIEVTSSGMTEVYTLANEPNPLRVSPMITEPNFAVLHIEKAKNSFQISLEYIGKGSQKLYHTELK
ncbi:MAG: alkaline phosphatase D family protein [Weeksellaceae bacterium]|nr:alkaline phosphatase D family protein [Weeksellaceae bacterium]